MKVGEELKEVCILKVNCKLVRRRRREEDGKDCSDDVVQPHSPHHHQVLDNFPFAKNDLSLESTNC